MDVTIATIRVIKQQPLPVSSGGFPEVYSTEYLKHMKEHMKEHSNA
jgi:hypothetical protein